MRSLPLSPPAAGLSPVQSGEGGLVRRAQVGDGMAFRLLFDRHAPAVRRLLRDVLGDASAADEATQETFVRAHGRLHSLRECDKLLPWLLGIARNVAFEQMRARRRPDGPSLMAGAADAGGPDEPVDVAPTPEVALLGQEADAMLATALATLHETRRTALMLRLDHGLGYDDIAEIMDWPLAKVKNEIHRARLQLRSQLTKYVGGAR